MAMRYFSFVIAIFSQLIFFQLHATSLDGTSSIIFKNQNYVFHDGDSAKGFVSLQNGFTVLSGEGVRLNIVMPVCDAIDLRLTGSMVLENNLIFDANLTLSGSGTINGNGHFLILNSDLVIPELSTLKITSSLTIEGNGNTILIDNFGQILVDAHSTLTLRNLIIKNVKNSSGKPPISTSAEDSKLALDNVVLNFNDNFFFNTGSFFIHNNVSYESKSQFLYQSAQPSYIAPNSRLLFDDMSTFFYKPQSSSSNLIVPESSTSEIYINGATLQTTPTSLTLTNGILTIENQSKWDIGTKLSSIVEDTSDIQYGNGNNPTFLDWRNDETFLAASGYSGSGNHFTIYQLNKGESPNTLSLIQNVGFGSASSQVYCAKWSYDGHFLAVCGSGAGNAGGFSNNDNLRIYEFNDTTLALEPYASVDFGITSTLNTLDWGGLDDLFVAVGGQGITPSGGFSNSHNLRIYHLDKINRDLTPIVSYDFGNAVKSVVWDFSGKYLAAGGKQATNICNLDLFVFDANQIITANKLVLTESQSFGTAVATTITSITWTNDSRYLAISGLCYPGSPTLIIYRFDPGGALGSQLSITTSATPIYYGNDYIYIIQMKWSSDGKFLMFGGVESFYGLTYNGIYEFYPNSEQKLDFLGGIAPGWYGSPVVAWNYGLGLISSSGWDALAVGHIYLGNFIGKSTNTVESKKYTTSYSTTAGVYGVDWSQDGKYIAIGGQGASSTDDFPNNDEIRIYRFNNYSEKLYPITSQGYGTRVYSTNWSPDGQYLAVGGYGAISSGGFANTDELRIYQFQNGYLNPVTSIPLGASSRLFNLAWHPSGKYLAVGAGSTSAVGGFPAQHNLRIYSFDGVTLNPVASVLLGTQAATGVDWRPDGEYLAVTTLNNPTNAYPDSSTRPTGVNALIVYKFQNYSSLVGIATALPGHAGFRVSWSSDNSTLAVTHGTAAVSALSIFDFDGTSLNLINTEASIGGFYFVHTGVKISPDNKKIFSSYIRDTNYAWTISGAVEFWSANQTSSSYVTVVAKRPLNGIFQSWATAWSPDSKYAAASWFNIQSGLPGLVIYKITNAINLSRLDYMGLNLGRYLDLNILGNSNVKVSGIVNYATQN